MNRVIAIAALSAIAGLAAAAPAGALTVAKPAHDTAVQQVHGYGEHHHHHHFNRYYRGPSVGVVIGGGGTSRCQKWKNICGDRWGWRTGNFYRCLDKHDAC